VNNEISEIWCFDESDKKSQKNKNYAFLLDFFNKNVCPHD